MYALVDRRLSVQYNDKLGQVSLHDTVTDATPSILTVVDAGNIGYLIGGVDTVAIQTSTT